MRTIKEFISLYLLLPFLLQAETSLNYFLNKHTDSIYQDLIIDNKIYEIGSDFCESRYKLIQPILDLYKGSFSILDLGAAQGYFSFRIAYDYPLSFCTMIEANNTSYYAHHGDMLYDLCLLNPRLENICYLQKRISIPDLHFLNQNEHFDIIIALLVVHLMDNTLKKQIEIIENLLTLADNLILEVANDVNILHTAHVEFLSQKLDCQYLGEVKRHRDLTSTSTGKLYWFKQKVSNPQNTSARNIQEKTFQYLNGVYPIY